VLTGRRDQRARSGNRRTTWNTNELWDTNKSSGATAEGRYEISSAGGVETGSCVYVPVDSLEEEEEEEDALSGPTDASCGLTAA